MRKQLQCPKCQHRKILFVTQMPDVLGDWSDEEKTQKAYGNLVRDAQSVTMRVARAPSKRYLASARTAGILQAYVCQSCGYTELYTHLPGSIPIDGEVVRLIDDSDPDNPHR